ncbi:retron St85 family RNA-directed DNA polymerase [Cereibacter azotoformans]|uniref:retron St85 family RNA-directed DNA polymerase n=1 Tax=Cereibacter azotoformans TaxID=43057 RepID=UPI000C6D9C36|nr:retron St85 family RNA-directed DNA polymerase [Cereibacter azotoformans]
MNSLTSLLASQSGLSHADVLRILNTAPKRYKIYSIPKRGGGMREIAQPSREVKLLQRIFVDEVLTKLPVHSAATAYRKGCSIRQNAEAHLGATPILKMDFKDFFPSLHGVDWLRYCRHNRILNESDAALSANLLFRKAKKDRTLKLSIGAPSSPALCNVLLFDFDSYVAEAASRRNIVYTRYADDLTFSGQRFGLLKDMPEIVRTAIREAKGPRLRVNEDKTVFVSSKFQRRVTGLVLTNTGTVSIGREQKRKIRASVHRALLNKLEPNEVASLKGYLAYIKSVEPEFLQVISRTYSDFDTEWLLP